MKYLLLVSLVLGIRAEEAKLYLQLGHSDSVFAAAFSPDGRFVATGGMDGSPRLWDAASGVEIRRFGNIHSPVTALEFSPDGRFLLAGMWDNRARMWDVASGAEVRAFRGHTERVACAAFSADGRFVVTGSEDHTARLWDAATGAEIHQLQGHTDWIDAVAFSPDGRFVLTGSRDQTARLWDAATGAEIRRFQGHTRWVDAVAFSPDGRSVLTGSWDNSVRLWDTATGAEIRRFMGHTAAVDSLKVSADRRYVLTASWDHTARLWDAATGAEIRQFLGHSEGVSSAVFSPDGRSVLTASRDKTARLWNLTDGTEIRRFEGYSDWVDAAAFSPDGRLMLLGTGNTARLWDTSSGGEIRQFRGHSHPIKSVAFSPDGRLAVTGSLDNEAHLWDVASGAEIRQFKGHSESARAAVFSPDGRFVLTGSLDRTARLWDTATGAEIRQFKGHTSGVNSVAFSPDGRSVLTGSDDRTARVWDTGSGAEVRRFQGFLDHPDEKSRGDVIAAAFSPDGRTVLTGTWLDTARLWDLSSGSEIHEFRRRLQFVTCAAFSPDGRFVITGDDATARLWDATNGAEIRQFQGHSAMIEAVAFSPDGRFVLTASEDGTARLWETSSGKWLATMVSFVGGGWAVTDPEGRYDASAPDAVLGLYWRVGTFRTIALAQLRRSFYTPGLLGSIFKEASLPPVKGLNDIASLPPVVSASSAGDRANPVLRVQLADIDKSGYGRVTIRINGRPFPAQPFARNKSDAAETLEYRLNEGRFADGVNEIAVTAASSDNLIESDRALVSWKQVDAARGVTVNQPSVTKVTGCAGRFYGIFVGAGTFPFASELNLKYPDSDAKALAEAVRLGAESLCGKDRVEILTLTGDNPDKSRQPTKENIRRAFQTVAAKSSRKDLLFVYLAGHGATPKNDPQSYFYMTADARQVDVDIPDKLRDATTISAAELAQWLINPDLPDKQVLILDTCAAAAANAQLSLLSAKARTAQDDLHKAVDNWNLDTGTFILMGSAQDRASYESDRFRHGLLTYALLHGMKGEALLDGSRLEAAHWFESTVPAVENYAAMIGREQKPVKGIPSAAGGVPVGFLPQPVRDRIVLADPAPEILKLTACFEQPVYGVLRDPLKLSGLIRSELRTLTSAQSRGGLVTYNDNSTEGAADALTPQVLYRVDGEKLNVTITLLQGDKAKAETVITLGVSDAQAAAQAIATQLVALASN